LRAAVHRALVAAVFEKIERACRIAFDAGPFLIGKPKACAAIADTTFARLIEQLGCAAIVAKDVHPFLESDRELIAVSNVASSAGAAKALGFVVSGMAACQQEADNHYR
jgi:hypothetical protein